MVEAVYAVPETQADCPQELTPLKAPNAKIKNKRMYRNFSAKVYGQRENDAMLRVTTSHGNRIHST